MKIQLLNDGRLCLTETPVIGVLKRLWETGGAVELDLQHGGSATCTPVSYQEEARQLKTDSWSKDVREIAPVATLILQVPAYFSEKHCYVVHPVPGTDLVRMTTPDQPAPQP